MMKSLNFYIYVLSVLLVALLGSCSEDDTLNGLTAEQQSLIGRAVNFNTSIADAFTTRASSYTDNLGGEFNQNDRMRIYRNYYGTNDWETDEAYRTYRYLYKSDEGTGIDLGRDWRPENGRQGYDDWNGDGEYTPKTQTENDSLTWENGKTVRFRAWSQSNYHDILNGASKTYYYPDFCAADYVVASGPSQSIPMILKHLGTRFRFQPLGGGNQSLGGGNEFADIRFCTYINPDGTDNPDGWKDYKYADNADTNVNDSTETEAGKTDDQAKAECEAVTAIFKRMCMPAGVDIKTGILMAIQNSWWQNASNNDVRFLEDKAGSNFIKYNTLKPEEIASQAKRPFFCNVNGNSNQLMVTIPYDISNDIGTQGELMTLPACTRFRVYMRDINNGDGYNTGNYEGKYHIFSLADVVDGSGNHPFENGLKLQPGVSYTFKVGYRYEGLYVVVNNDLSWVNQDLAEKEGKDEVVIPTPSTEPYKWWQNAIHSAIPTGTEDFRPVFHIKNETEFLEFINLVNGTATTKTDGLYLLDYTYKDGQGNTKTEKRWSTVNSIYKPNWVTEEEMEEQGYIFYDHYYAANADKAAYSQRDYLKGPYPFYDDNLRRNFEIKLDADLDMKDWALESIGRDAVPETTDTQGNTIPAKPAAPFMGNFDGQGHTIKNLYMKDENVFGLVNGNGTEHASITNLKIESLHNTCLIGTGINQIYIVGVSLHAPSTTNSIAHSMSMDSGVTGTSLVVGCIHVGDAGGALVGTASNLNMFGCMQAAQGITGGALIGTDANTSQVFKPQYSLAQQRGGTNVNAKPAFRNFVGNYYDKELSPSANAVGSTADDYSLLEYIRGSNTDILRAKNDFLTKNVSMKQLLALSNYKNYYGLAPWKVMNYAIHWYNTNRVNTQVNHKCTMHYENNSTGYAHQYPVLMSEDPLTKYGDAMVSGWNPVSQTN